MDKTMMPKILKNHTKWSRIAISIVLIGTSWLYFAVLVQQTVHFFFLEWLIGAKAEYL